MLHLSLLPILLLVAIPAQAEIVNDGADLDGAYTYINQLRQQTDMIGLSKNDLLQQSAANHAEYLILNQTYGHGETSGDKGFTGVSVGDRALYAGYLSNSVSENISAGDQDYKSSIDGLMSAIYHRFGFLDFAITAIGVGISRVSLLEAGDARYVYNMSNAGFHELCKGETDTTSRIYYNPCPNDPDFAVGQETYETTRDTAIGLNPNIVLWPNNNATDIQPIFTEESPDPLPDYSISGYPVSIQFNPLTYESVAVSNFSIYRDKDNMQLTSTRELNAATDPNGKFSNLEYALFPLERLEWNTRYRVELTYSAQLINGTTETKNLAWEFNTRQLGVPLYTVSQGQTISVPFNSEFAVYFPLRSITDTASQVRWSYSHGMVVNPSIIDSSTLKLNLTGENGNLTTFSFSDGREFSIQIDSTAQLVSNTLMDVGDEMDSVGLNTTNNDDSTTDDKDDSTTDDKDDSTTDDKDDSTTDDKDDSTTDDKDDSTTDDKDDSTTDDKDDSTTGVCTDASCTYTLNVEQEGFYVMTIELPEGGTEGFWGISLNTTAGYNPGGFNAGAILKENGNVPGFVGFYISDYEAVNLTPYEYLGIAENVLVRIKSNDVVLFSDIVKSGSLVTTDVLAPGFYVAEVLSQDNVPRGLSGISVNASSFSGGVNVGGWIDRKTSGSSAGFGAFYVASPQQVNVNLYFGDTYGSVGSSKLHADLYLQEGDSRTLKWSSKN